MILAAFPKTGSTWVRFILANALALLEFDRETIDYHALNGKFVCSYESYLFPTVEYRSLPRFVKTHMVFSRRRFGSHRSLYVCRNPGDTMVSYFEYARARRDLAWMGSFKEFIRTREFGVEAWCRHVKSWEKRRTASLLYEDLKRDPVQNIAAALDVLGVPRLDEGVIQEAVWRSDFGEIRQIEEASGLDERARANLKPGFHFARRGQVGQWKEYFDREDLGYLQEVTERWDVPWSALPTESDGDRSVWSGSGGRR